MAINQPRGPTNAQLTPEQQTLPRIVENPRITFDSPQILLIAYC